MGNSAEDREPDLPKEILRYLSDNDIQKVFLLGKLGVGKAWTAREVCRRAWQRGFSYGTLWYSPDDNLIRRRVPEDYGRRIPENVALQLSVYSSDEDCEDDEDDSEEQVRDDRDKEDPKERIQKKLEAMKLAAKVASRKDGKTENSSLAIPEPQETPKSNQGVPPVATQEKEKIYILVVLDGIAIENQNKILEGLKVLLPFPKYLIIGTDSNESTKHTGSEIHLEENYLIYPMRGLSVQGSLELLKRRVKGDVRASSNFEKLCSAIRHAGSALPDERSSHEPGSKSDMFLQYVMVMLGEALNNAHRRTLGGGGDEEHVGEWTLESAMEEAPGIFESCDVNRMVNLVYEMFPRNGTVAPCSWHCRHLFVNPRAMHCNELTLHWLLEGYFGDLEQIEVAFEEAHRTLMDLKDRSILKEQENSFIYIEGAEVKLHDRRHGAFHATTRLGLAMS